MRLLLLGLLIALTPLRVMAADTMAVRMAATPLGGHTSVAAPEGAASAHCMETMGSHTDATATTSHAPAEGGDTSDCHNCAACQICFTAAIVTTPATLAPAALQPIPLANGSKAAPDADPRRVLDPPIS